jgi:hypothetical protein
MSDFRLVDFIGAIGRGAIGEGQSARGNRRGPGQSARVGAICGRGKWQRPGANGGGGGQLVKRGNWRGANGEGQLAEGQWA